MNTFLLGKNRSLKSWQLFNLQFVDYFQEKSFTLARLCVCLAIICLPFSHFLVNQLTLIATIFAIFAGDWKAKLRYVAQFPFVWWGFAFIFILIVGIIYSEASLGKAASGFSKYSKILFILFFIPLFRAQHWRNYAIHCLIYALTFAELISILGNIDLLDLSTIVHAYPKIFPQIDRQQMNIVILLIPFSALSAFIGFLLLHFIVEKKHRVVYICLFALNTYHLLFVSGERTGYYSFILLSLLFLLQRLGLKKGILLSACIMPSLIFSFYHFVPQFQEKSNMLVTEISDYQHGDYHSSTGYRLEFIRDSFKLIKANPVFGVGTGGFIPAYQRIDGVVNQGRPILSDPHNDYIYILVEIGALGLSIFLLWLISLLIFSFKLPKSQQWLAQGLIINFMFNSLTNATLILPPTGFLLMLFISIFFASYNTEISWKKMSPY